MEEKIISTERIFDGRIIHLDVITVELPNGQPGYREMVQHPGAVAIVALDDMENVLLVRQFRLAAGRVMREIPAGTLNSGEDPDLCAVRELQEETGYRPGKLEKIGGIYVAPGYTTEFIHLYQATDLAESRLAMDEDEFLELDRVPFGEALAMIDRGEIIDGKSISALLLVARRMGR